MLKLATWNVNSLRVRLSHLTEWLSTEQPDIIGLQELKLHNDHFPSEAFTELGYHAVSFGQKTYNGVAILSKTKPADTVMGIPNFEDTQARVIAATIANIRFISIYAPNGQSVGSDKFVYKLEWFAALKDYLRDVLAHYPNVAVVGDFNVAPENRDVHNPRQWQGHVLVSSQEREVFYQLISLGLSDSFRLFEQPVNSFSWWDYRNLAFQRNEGLRIDHILVSASMAMTCAQSWIDIKPRSKDRPSDHTPVISSFLL